jgi:hypothetical protein
MKKQRKTGQSVGIALFCTAIFSLVSGALLLGPLIIKDNYQQTLSLILNNTNQFNWGVFVDLLTALAIFWLAAGFYTITKIENRILALTAFAAFIFEAVSLGISKILLYGVYFNGVGSFGSESLGTSLLLLSDLSYNLHMLGFCSGGILFYFLLAKSSIIPRILAIWGCASLFPLLIGTILKFFQIEIPIIFYVPYIPFEFVTGIWIMVKGINQKNQKWADNKLNKVETVPV